MSNRIRELATKSVSDGVGPSADELDGGPLVELLDDRESIQYVHAGSSGIEHTTNGRSTSIEPGRGTTAYMVVTDRHVYYVLGDEPSSSPST